MTTQSTEEAESERRHGGGEPNGRSRTREILSAVAGRGRNGTIATLAGGILLADAVRTAGRETRRTGACAIVGSTLLGVGLEQRRSKGETSPADGRGGIRDGAESTREGGESAEARAHGAQSDVLHQPERNPRGVSGEPDVETETEPREGDVRFTTDGDEAGEAKPHLDGTNGEDPRVPDDADPTTPDDHVEVDLSETSLADEASEATGPDPEQAYPAREGTDPEPMSEQASPRRGEGAVAPADPDADDEDRADDGNRAVEGESEDADENGT